MLEMYTVLRKILENKSKGNHESVITNQYVFMYSLLLINIILLKNYIYFLWFYTATANYFCKIK